MTQDNTLLTIPRSFQETVLTLLTTPTPLREQVRAQLSDQYACLTDEDIEIFFKTRVLELEEYVSDLLFSPKFTPKKEEKLALIQKFAGESFTLDDLKREVDTLASMNLQVSFVLPSGLHVQTPLQSVMIERFLKTLALHKPVPEALRAFIETEAPADFQGLLAWYARDPLFHFEKYQDVFKQMVLAWNTKNTYSIEQCEFFFDFMKTYTPQSLQDLEEKLDRLIQSCQDYIATAGGRSYHHPQISGSHSGSSHDLHEAEVARQQYTKWIEEARALKQSL